MIGKHVDLPIDDNEMNEVFDELMNEAAKVGEHGDEFEVHDVETDINGIYDDISRLGLKQLNDLAEQFEGLESHQMDGFAAVIQVTDDIEEAIEMIDEAIVLDDVSNEKDLGEALHFDGLLGMEIPERLESFIDWEAI